MLPTIATLDAGGRRLYNKPFSSKELLARIRAVLRRTPLFLGPHSGVVAFEGLKINLASRRITVRGAEVRLTPKEFDLLHYLLVNSNMTSSHEKILQAVWDPIMARSWTT